VDDETVWGIGMSTYIQEWRFALKLGDPADDDEEFGNCLAKNSKAAHIYVLWYDQPADDPDAYNSPSDSLYLSPDYGADNGNSMMSCTVGGCTRDVYGYNDTPPDTNYGTLETSINPDTWTAVTADYPGYNASDRYMYNPSGTWWLDPSGDYWEQRYKGEGRIYLNRVRDYVYYELDFDSIETDVFIDDSGRDRIGAEG